MMAKTTEQKKFKISDAELYDLVKGDIDAAEDYFDTNIKPELITRYQLLNGNKDYYRAKFPTLSASSDFTTSDVKDAIEWIMPSIIEVILGAEKIVGVMGRTPEDNPKPMEKLMAYQIKSQNKGYLVIEQWARDCLEAGLGVIAAPWERVTTTEEIEVVLPEEEFLQMDATKAKKVVDNGDDTYTVTIDNEVREKDQPVLNNLMPGRFIYLPDTDNSGAHVFEAERGYMLYSDLLKMEKAGLIEGVKDVIDPKSASESEAESIDDLADAIANYSGQRLAKQSEEPNATKYITQPGREKILYYKARGKYDVDGDGILEDVDVMVVGNAIVSKEISKFSRSPYFDAFIFEKSYCRWKEGVADLLQDVQDIKTALIRQVIINTALNNDRKTAVDERQTNALDDLTGGNKCVRVKLSAGQSIKDVIDHFPQHELSHETFSLIELIQGWSEQKTGVTRYNQGLDAESLNKTATGISKIMAASQQKLRKMTRNFAETGLVPLYSFLVEMNQAMVDKEMVVRLTGEYLTINPDDLKGTLDTEIISNIGLQDSQLTVQNLMIMMSQIIPGLMQMGIANEAGVYQTAKQLIEAMGFTRPETFIGRSEQDVQAMMQQKDVMSQLPQLLAGLMQQAGIDPQRAAAVVQGLAMAMQPQQSPDGNAAQQGAMQA
jgi:hypothetical protein